jgi:glycosyltransferase involved in cell wall biosynthesis
VPRALLVHQPTDGGVGRHVSDLVNGLTELGYDVQTCGPAPPAPLRDASRHLTLDLRRAVAPRADAASLAQFARILRQFAPDIVHAHSSKAGAIVRLARVARPRVPVVYTPHGYAFAGYFTDERERRAYREVERILGRLATRVVCVCEAEAVLARSVGPAGRIRVVHNGVPQAASGPRDQRAQAIADEGPVVCTLTQLRPGKGLETLIDATPAILARHPRAKIAVWGVGPDAASLRQRAERNGVETAVLFLGETDDPLAVLRPAAAFVLPSWAESFP